MASPDSRYVGAATRPIAEREARRAQAAKGNLLMNENASKKRRPGALVALESIPEGMIKPIDTVKFGEAQEMLKERCQREDMTINSGLIRASEKSMRQAVLNQVARRRAPAKSKLTRPQVTRIDDPPSQDISQFTASAEHRPAIAVKPIHRRVGQLRFTTRTPPPTLPRQPQVRRAGMGSATYVERSQRARPSASTSSPSPSPNPSTQGENVQPTHETERLGPNLVKHRAERMKQQLQDGSSEQRPVQIHAAKQNMSPSHQDQDVHQELQVTKSQEQPVPSLEMADDTRVQMEAIHDQIPTASQAHRNEDVEGILNRMEDDLGSSSQRQSSLERDLSNITASQAQRFVEDELGADGDWAGLMTAQDAHHTEASAGDNGASVVAHTTVGTHGPAKRQSAAEPIHNSVPDILEPQPGPQRQEPLPHQRPPLANLPLQGGMSGVDLTDYLVKMLQAPVQAQETTRQVKNRRRALRIEQKKDIDDAGQAGHAPRVNRWPLAAPSTQSSANAHNNQTSPASSPPKFASSKQVGSAASRLLMSSHPVESPSKRPQASSNSLPKSRSTSKLSNTSISEASPVNSDDELEQLLQQPSRRLSPTQINTPDPSYQDGIRPLWSRKAIAPQASSRTPKSPGWRDVEQSRQVLSQREHCHWFH